MPRVILQSASYSARSLIANAQRCINLYPEANPPDASAPTTFYSTPGKLLRWTLPIGPVRCLYQASDDSLYAVGGSILYRYSGSSWVAMCSFASTTGPVIASDNGISAVFVDGTTTAPTVNLSSLLVDTMSGEGWYGADFVDYLDGFFIFNKPGTQQFYITGALDLTLDALDFASAESVPDRLMRAIKDHSELWMFGPRSIEVFSNGGGADFPFARIGGAVIETGCAAAYSIAKMDNTLFWLGADERGSVIVYRASAQTPIRISTHALEEEMRTYSRVDDAEAFSYQQSGHSFYVLTFPTASKTWAYDAATSSWAERAYRTSANALTRDRASCHVFYQGKHLVGDYQSGNIYELDPDTYTDNGAPIVRIKSFQHMVADGKRQFFRSLTLDMQAGVGSSLELDPQIMLRYSDDGANTWSALLTTSMGRIGQYRNKANFNRLGMGRDRVFEVSTTANARVVLQGAFIEAATGTA